ncbi:MAG: lysylphosphatidylglycerol synthase transmembrane domain-containing protein [Bacteroidota bacterium]
MASPQPNNATTIVSNAEGKSSGGIISENPVSAGTKKTTKQRMLSLMRIVIALVLLISLSVSIDFSKIISSLLSADGLFIGVSLLLLIPNIYLQYMKWEILCTSVLKEKHKKSILLSLLYGFSAGSVTPMRLGEYVGRRMALKNSDMINVTAATMADKIFLMIVTYLFGLLSCILFMYFYTGIGIYIFFLLTALTVLVLGIMGLLIMYPGRVFYPVLGFLKRISFLRKYIDGGYSDVIDVVKGINKMLRIRLSAISLLLYICMMLQYCFLVAAFSHQWLPFDYILAGNLVVFSKTLLPFSFGDLGIRESASVFFLTHMGVSAAVAFNASIFLFLINVFLPSVAGSVLLIRGNK